MNSSPSDCTLSKQELDVLQRLAAGMSSASTSQALGISPRTLRRRLRGACDHLGVATPIEAIAWAARRRLI